jgi:anti-anti-sigma factor
MAVQLHRKSVRLLDEPHMTTSADYKLVGRLDGSTAAAHEKSIQELLAGGANSIALDMSQLDYLSSAGLRVLVITAKAVKTRGGKMVLKSPQPAILDVLEASGLDQFVQIQP